MSSSSEEAQAQQRRANLDAIVQLGFAAYPNRFDVSHSVTELVAAHSATPADELQTSKVTTTTAGRIVSIRSFGKTCFYVLSDGR